MVNIKYVRENLEEVKKSLAKRHTNVDLEKVIKLDEEKKDLQNRIETLRAEANQLAKEGKSADRRTDKAVEVKQMLKDLEPQLAEVQENYKVAAAVIP
ncbi:MAG: Serine-tRNA ligase, partial [Berkelbacteria bacterium GW2011_GWB1_38_5]